MGVTTVAKAWAEAGTSPLILMTFRSQIHCSWDSTNTTRNRSKGVGMADVHTGPTGLIHPYIYLLAAAVRWHGRRHFFWYERELLLPLKCQGSLLLLLTWTHNSPLASYFSALRLPILLPSSSSPWQCFRLRPKHSVRDTRDQLWPYLP